MSRSFLDTHIDAIPALLLPLDLWGQGFAQVSIPYGDVAGSMALVIVPTAMGIFLKQSSARYAAWGETFGSVLGAGELRRRTHNCRFISNFFPQS